MPKNASPKLQAWIEARKRHHLSDAHVQMARELGMNPTKLGGLDNHRQEPWKLPLPEFIEQLYEKRFGKRRPDVVTTLEERARGGSRQGCRTKDCEGGAPGGPNVGCALGRGPWDHQGDMIARARGNPPRRLKRSAACLRQVPDE
jgi:hypothetical protein